MCTAESGLFEYSLLYIHEVFDAHQRMMTSFPRVPQQEHVTSNTRLRLKAEQDAKKTNSLPAT